MAKCPECGEPSVKEPRNGKYSCKNESCPDIYMERPSKPAIRRIVRTSLSRS